KRGRAVAVDRNSADILEQRLGSGYIGAERLPRLTIGPRVVPTVARQLVARRDDAPHHRRMPLGNPAEREERRVYARAGELKQKPFDIGVDPAREIIPGGTIDTVRERLDLEVILDVHGHRVDDRHGFFSTAAASIFTMR